MKTGVGNRVKTRDAERQVTGALKYAGDLKIPGLLFGKVLRSEIACGKLLYIDTRQAKRQPGVKFILTGSDLPAVRFGRFLKDQYLLAREQVLYNGEPVAAIAAIDEDTAEYAKELIRVDYEPSPPVLDPVISMQSGAPLLHPKIETYLATWPVIRKGNICSTTIIRRGEIESGFAQSDYLFENTFETPCVHQCPIETQIAIAYKDANGCLQVVMPAQHAFGNQLLIAEALQIPTSKICVRVSPAGGSFGSKIENIAGLYASLLGWHCDQAVKVVFSRKEEFFAVTPRHPSKITHKTGVKKDGSLMAWQSRVVFDTGAYAWAGPVVTGVATMFSTGPYRIPNIDLVGDCVYTNKIPNGAFRGYGNPQAAFAHESQMDIIAKELNIDPLEIRLKNAVEEGDPFTLGYPYRCVTLKKTLNIAVQESGWRDIRGKNRGIGIACIQHVTGGLPSNIILKANSDGTITLMSGMPEIGTGVSTIASQVVSEELSLPIEMIDLTPVQTDLSPYEYGLGISRSCFNIGHATRLASIDLKQKLLKIASDILQTKPTNLNLKNGGIYDAQTDRWIALKEVVEKALSHQEELLLGKGTYAYPPIQPDPDICQGMPIPGFPQCTFATQVAEIEVDPETGQIKILNITAVHDVGKAINPNIVRGQITGGILQGIGYALLEELRFLDGAPVNTNLLDYKIPTSMDVPPIKIVVLEESDPEGPFGAKGVGELPIIATAPAIANAVENAVGVRVKTLPLSFERIKAAIKAIHGGLT